MAGADKTYYEILGIKPDAAKPEIDRAYLALKTGSQLQAEQLWALERAYVSLSDPNLKRKYDAEQLQRSETNQTRQTRQSSSRGRERAPVDPIVAARRARLVLAVSGLAFALVIYTQVWPHFAVRYRTFPTGTVLVQVVNSQPFGTVVSFEGSHRFPQGKVAPAYLLRLVNGEERWLPKLEVNALAEPAP